MKTGQVKCSFKKVLLTTTGQGAESR
jgi:hypothetical protein